VKRMAIDQLRKLIFARRAHQSTFFAIRGLHGGPYFCELNSDMSTYYSRTKRFSMGKRCRIN
jgi:hypothetical protein